MPNAAQAINKISTSHGRKRLRGSWATLGRSSGRTSGRPQNLQNRLSGEFTSPQAKHEIARGSFIFLSRECRALRFALGQAPGLQSELEMLHSRFQHDIRI